MEGKTLRKAKFKTRMENATRKVNKQSRIRVWWWRRAGWWWKIELISNMKSRRKPLPQVRGGIPEGAVCDLETGVDRWLMKNDQCGWSSGSRRLDCHEITQVTRRRRLKELMHGGNNFVFNAFLYFEPVQQFENRVRIGGSGSCNNSTSKYHSGYVEGDLTVFSSWVITVSNYQLSADGCAVFALHCECSSV